MLALCRFYRIRQPSLLAGRIAAPLLGTFFHHNRSAICNQVVRALAVSAFAQGEVLTREVAHGCANYARNTLACVVAHLCLNYFFFNPACLLALLKDVLVVNMHAWTAFFLCALVPFICARTIQFMYHEDRAQFLAQTFLLGSGIFIAVIVVEAGQGPAASSNDALLFLLIPVFLFLGLLAHALAQVIYIRHYHLSAMHGSIHDQERSIFLWTGISGLLLVIITLVIAFIANGSLLTGVQQSLTTAYNWLVNGLAVIVTFLLTPFVWLFWFIAHLFGKQQSTSTSKVPQCAALSQFAAEHGRHYGCTQEHFRAASDTNYLLLLTIIKLMLPTLVLLITLILIGRAVHQRRLRSGVVQSCDEMHESIWSWTLFWQQLKAFWLVLWLRFFPPRSPKEEQPVLDLRMENVPAVRSIREIYRLLLKRAARRGYARKKNETPYEYLSRLSESMPLLVPQLIDITEAYTSVRYGSIVPGEAEINQLRTTWKKLEEQWK